MLATPAYPQDAITTENMIGQLSGLETTPDLDIVALRQQALDRIKSKADGASLKRPPVAAELLKLPHFNVDVQFNPNSPIIRPKSYRTLGRIADALYDPALSSYGFLIVGHTEATGKREYNLTLSQRRAKIDPWRACNETSSRYRRNAFRRSRIGEEQLQDATHPTAAVDHRSRWSMTFRKAL